MVLPRRMKVKKKLYEYIMYEYYMGIGNVHKTLKEN